MKRPRGDPPPRATALLAIFRPDLVFDEGRRYRCTSCSRRRIRRAFGDNKRRPDGRAVQCRQCKREASVRARARSKREVAKLRKMAIPPFSADDGKLLTEARIRAGGVLPLPSQTRRFHVAHRGK